MRKAQKEQAESFIRLLGQAHDEIRKAIEKGQTETALEILEQCQDGAIQLGSLIEATEGNGFITVSYLESYCELVYETHGEIVQEQNVSGGKVYKNLRRSLIKIENSVRNDIKIRTEVVFLPYKASMWDSLESVWKAADENPDCDAYVIPIPYYDRNQDGSFGELHYEGNQYPKYVPVIWYKDYDFEKRRPDMIYIHNPYDDCNYVTSVHPSFYSSRLKQYTDELVYIPYFILGEIDTANKEAMDSIEHFVTVPAVMNADKIIVQSENMRKVYIEILAKAMGESSRNGWKKKILGLGSPKIDKVLNTKKEGVEIPDEWLRLIEKPDGSRKKIIFYNTSVVALLEQNEKMLEKMRYVFGVFKENKDRVTLLWRPHPLVKATLESMRPQLWEEYQKILKQYQAEDWGIYDDTADIDRAIVLSDAYYGDKSSVVQMYQCTKKPILLQNMSVRDFDWETVLFGKGIIACHTEMWMPLVMINAMVRVDLTTGYMERCCGFGDVYLEKDNHTYMYTDVTEWEEQLYFVPMRANAIAVFDKKSGNVKNKKIAIPGNFVRGIPNYAIGIKSSKELFFIGICETNLIVRWNMETGEIDFHGQEINNCAEMKNEAVYGRNAIIIDEFLYIPLYCAGSIYELNLTTKKEKILHIDFKNRKLVTINYWNNVYYITTNTGELLKWSGDILEEVKIPDNGEFYSSFCADSVLWLFPRNYQKSVLKIDLIHGNVQNIHFPYVVYDVFQDDKGTIFLNTRGGIGMLDPVTNYIERKKYRARGMENNPEQIVSKWNDETNFKIGRYEGSPEYNTLSAFFGLIEEERYENK